MSSTGGMTFLYLPTFTKQITLEDKKVAVLKAGLTNQNYRKEMRLISKYGTVSPDALNQDLITFAPKNFPRTDLF